jgi:hypothetical protein
MLALLVLFPEGFHAPRIMDPARLQAWTLKPALLAPTPSNSQVRIPKP